MKYHRRQETLDWLLDELRALDTFSFDDVAPYSRQVRDFKSVWRQLTRQHLERVGGTKRNTFWRVKEVQMAQYDQQVAQRVIDRLIALHVNDDVISKAGPVEQATWLTEHPYLTGVAGWGKLALHDVLLASMSQSYEWGASFERAYRRPPAMDDWRGAYYDIANQFCQQLGMPDAFDDTHRLRLEFGGPF